MIALLPCMSALSLELSPWAVLAFRMSTSSRCLLERPVQDHTVFIVPGQWEFQIWKYKMQVRRSASLGAICGNFRHSEDFFSGFIGSPFNATAAGRHFRLSACQHGTRCWGQALFSEGLSLLVLGCWRRHHNIMRVPSSTS